MKRTLGALLVLTGLVGLGGCGGSSGTPIVDGGVNSSSGTVNGRVGGASSAASRSPDVASASMATVFQIQSNGALAPLSSPIAISADGTYSASVAFTGTSISDLLVQISGGASADGGSTGGLNAKALVAAALQAGGTVTATPADSQSTVQGDASIAIHESGNWGANTNDAQLEAMLDAETTAVIAASASYSTDVLACGASMQAAMNARAAMLLNSAVGVTQSQLAAYLSAEESAQVQEDIALNAAASQADVTAALQARAAAEIQAASTAGITASQLGRAAVASEHAQVAAMSSGSMAVQAAVELRAETLEAASVEFADQAELVALSASAATQSDVANAQGALSTAIAGSLGNAATIATAWAAYDVTLKADLIATLEADRPGATASFNALVIAEANALGTLNTQLTAAGSNGSALATAYATYQASINAAVQVDAALSLLSTAQQSAMVNLLLDIQTAG